MEDYQALPPLFQAAAEEIGKFIKNQPPTGTARALCQLLPNTATCEVRVEFDSTTQSFFTPSPEKDFRKTFRTLLLLAWKHATGESPQIEAMEFDEIVLAGFQWGFHLN